MKRRKFIKNVGATGLAFTVVPSFAVSGLGHTAPSDKLNIAAIGVGKGGKGKVNLKNMVEQNIVALCDVDYDYAASTFETYPKAKKYKDYRKMLNEMDEQIDANIVKLEKATGKTFGHGANPLLVSVRSGAAVSMPGMMDTVLNLGLNDETLQAMIDLTGNDVQIFTKKLCQIHFRKCRKPRVRLRQKSVIAYGHDRPNMLENRITKVRLTVECP